MVNTKTFLLILILINSSLFISSQAKDASINDSEKSIKIWRTTNNTNEVIAFPINSFTVSANTEKYINMLVNYPSQPDIAIAIDAENQNSDGDFSDIIRPLNNYTNFGKWETLVFPISGGLNGIEVNTLLIYPDLGIRNESAEQILNDSGSFGYIDEITLRNSNVLDAENFSNQNTTISPNPANNIIKIKTRNKISKILLFNNLGKEITNRLLPINKTEYNINRLPSGLYFIKLVDETGFTEIKKIIKR
jgi:hypothetical protein